MSSRASTPVSSGPNAKNERIKKTYESFLRHSEGLKDITIRQRLAAVRAFEKRTSHADFGSFNANVAIEFKENFCHAKYGQSEQPISPTTYVPLLRKVMSFFSWLSRENGYRSKIKPNDIRYLSPSLSDSRKIRRTRLRKFPTLHHCKKAFRAMPLETFSHRRAKAFFALAMLTCNRTGGEASLQIGAVNFDECEVIFDALACETKGDKSYPVYFMPVENCYADFLQLWINELMNEHHFTYRDWLFPTLNPKWSLNGTGNQHPSTNSHVNSIYISQIFKGAFEEIGMDGITPHSLRTMMVHYVDKITNDITSKKAFSQNLGHESIVTTADNYTNLSIEDQERIMRKLRKKASKKRAKESKR